MSSTPTLREKIGQLLLVGFRGSVPAECETIVGDIREHHIGSVILFDQDMTGGTVDSGGPRTRNIVSPDQVRSLLAYLQAQAAVPLLESASHEKPTPGLPALPPAPAPLAPALPPAPELPPEAVLLGSSGSAPATTLGKRCSL